MKILRPSDKGYAAALRRLNRTAKPDPAVQAVVAEVLAATEAEGDVALLRYHAKFGGGELAVTDLAVLPAEVAEAVAGLDQETRKAIDAAITNVRAFAKRSMRKTWFSKNKQGATVGERFDPLQRVGVYIPGGTAPLVSSAIMTATLAAVAGCPEIVAVTPADPRGVVHPALLAALHLSGATEIYRVGGSRAIAALALGTQTIRPVLKIFGPGNAYVVEAKRQVFGRVAIDLLPGPSEVLVIGDASSQPDWIAADILAQCEHGHGSAAVLVTDSEILLAAVEKEVQAQTLLSQRPKELEKALKNVALILVADRDAMVRVANDYAAEHVAIAAQDPGDIALRLRTSGAIFLGGLSPVAAGDFLAGPSHELPTGGAGKSFAGLTVDQFQRRTSVVMFDKKSLAASAATIGVFSRIEGLDAHGRSVSIRLQP